MKKIFLFLALLSSTFLLTAQNGVTIDGSSQDVIIQGFGADLLFRNTSGTDIAQFEPGAGLGGNAPSFTIKHLQEGDMIFENNGRDALAIDEFGHATFSGNVTLGDGIGVLSIKDGADFFSFGQLWVRNLVDDQPMKFFTSTGGNPVERMQISGTGRIAMATGNFSHTVNIGHDTGSSDDHGLKLLNKGANLNFWSFYTNNGDGSLVFSENGTPVKELQEDGDFVDASDKRLKSNIDYFSNGYLDKINQLKPAQYYYKRLKHHPNKSIGFIAQEVQEVFPELVRELATDNKKGEKYLGVIYKSFIPILVKGMQEQQTIIEDINTQNEQLQNTINRLDADNQQLNQRLKALENSLTQQQTSPQMTTPTPVIPKNQQQILVEDKPQLQQNFPNPFHQTTEIQYYLPASVSAAQLHVSDLSGKVLKTYPLTTKGIGKISMNGNELAAGTYVYTLSVNGKVMDTKKMILTK